MKKTILITGSTDGIGKLTALQLAKAGHQVLVHGRSAPKLEQTIGEVSAVAVQPVRGFLGDLSDLADVRRLAQAITAEVDTLDVLINNAGVFKAPVSKDNNGLDIRFTVNYLAPYLLTYSLELLLQRSPAPRVVNLSSAAQAPVSLAALAGKEPLGAQGAYAQSKLALTMWSFELARAWDFATVIAVNPGSLLNTKMVQEAYGRHWDTADKGANILVELATQEAHSQSSGKYFDNDRGAFGPAHADAYDQDSIDALLEQTKLLIN